MHLFISGILALSLTTAAPPVLDEAPKPQVASPHDVALVVGIAHYPFVAPVPWADRDALAFKQFLLEGRGVPPERIRTLIDDKASKEAIEDGVKFLLQNAEADGTVWIYFAGHGASANDGKDGLLVGMDVQQTEASVLSRAVSRSWLAGELGKSNAKQNVMLIDACFSGKTRTGGELVSGLRPMVPVRAPEASPRVLVLTAASQDETSGPFDAAKQGLFSYFAIGGLRGWADLDSDGAISARELAVYVRRGAATVLSDGSRSQTPSINADAGDARLGWQLASGTSEHGPDLSKLATGRAQSAAVDMQVGLVRPSEVPAMPSGLKEKGAIDLGVDTDALVAYDAALKADSRGKEDPEAASAAWTALYNIKNGNPYQDDANLRARQWRDFAEKKKALAIQREADQTRLQRVMPLAALNEKQKAQLLQSYRQIYGAEGIEAVIAAVMPVEERGRFCAEFASYEQPSTPATLQIHMPRVDGELREGTVFADGKQVGSATQPVRIPNCAVAIEVREASGGTWKTSRDEPKPVLDLTPTFAGIVDDRDRPPELPAEPPTENDLHFEAAGILYPSYPTSTALIDSTGSLVQAGYDFGRAIGIEAAMYLPTRAPGVGIQIHPFSLTRGRVEWRYVAFRAVLFLDFADGGPAAYFTPVAESLVRIRYGSVALRLGASADLFLLPFRPRNTLPTSAYFGLQALAGFEYEL